MSHYRKIFRKPSLHNGSTRLASLRPRRDSERNFERIDVLCRKRSQIGAPLSATLPFQMQI